MSLGSQIARFLDRSIRAAPPTAPHDLMERAVGTCGQWSNEPDRLPGRAP